MTAPRTPGARSGGPRRARHGRRPERAALAVLGLLTLVAAAWLAVVGRRAVTAATPVAATAPPAAAEEGTDQPVDGAGATAVAELSRVSGLGRRSAEALVAGGITSLSELAERTDDELAAVLDDAGVQRSTTLATWASQARRLVEG